jgi:hypothetical protein
MKVLKIKQHVQSLESTKIYIPENKKIFKSASLTFFSKKHGFLLCKEERDHRLVIHPIGGKYEKCDENIEMTAAREFVEETGIMKNADYIDYIRKKSEKSENNEIIDYTKEMKNVLYNLLEQDCTHYFDYYVNKERYFVHRYYLINIDHLEDELKSIFEKIDTFYNITYDIKKNEYIDSLVWNKDIIQNKRLNKKDYSMLTIYLSYLLKNINNE